MTFVFAQKRDSFFVGCRVTHHEVCFVGCRVTVATFEANNPKFRRVSGIGLPWHVHVHVKFRD